MIELILASGLLSWVEQPPAEISPFIRDKRDYEECVTAHALVFETAKESVEDTVRAAFSACQNERATLYFTMEKTKKDKGQEFDQEWAERFIKTLIEDRMRDDLKVELFKLRSERR